MKLYGAIDLHSNNNVTVLIDEQDKVVYEKRLPNDLGVIAQQLAAYQSSLEGIVVESTYNWYWLVDGLMDKGHQIHLANTAAIQQYEGLKYTDDHSDARWLAHILRLGVLPQGYIYPKEERAVRDLLRKRGQMVRQRTANLLSIQNLITRNTGSSISSNRIKTLDSETVDALLPNQDLALAVKANLAMIQCADGQIDILERTVTDRVKLRAEFSFLKTVPGIGQILALTIMLETGEIRSSQLRDPIQCEDQKLLSEKEGQEPWCVGDQGGSAQAVPGLLLHSEEPGCVRYRQGVCRIKKSNGWDGAVSLYRGWFTTTRPD